MENAPTSLGEVIELATKTPEKTAEKIPMWKQLGLTEKQYREVQYQARLELARKDFWEFCKLLAPDFYMEGRD